MAVGHEDASKARLPQLSVSSLRELAENRPSRVPCGAARCPRRLNCGHRCQHDPQTRHGTSVFSLTRSKGEDAFPVSERGAGRFGPPRRRDSPARCGAEVAEDEKLVVGPLGPKQTTSADAVPGMDGTGVPVRKEELVDRPGKTREVTLVTIWSAKGGPRKARASATSTRISHSARSKRGAPRKTSKKGLTGFARQNGSRCGHV